MTDGRQRRLVERIVEPEYLEGLAERPFEELRALRDECKEGENELSFERRLCQARIDILSGELDRRAGKGEGDLLERLPAILATEGSSGSGASLPSRAPDFSIPRNVDVPRRRVEEIVGEQTLSRLATVSDDELRGIIASLRELEGKVSARRRDVQKVVDQIQAEIVRRYSTGEEDPTSVAR